MVQMMTAWGEIRGVPSPGVMKSRGCNVSLLVLAIYMFMVAVNVNISSSLGYASIAQEKPLALNFQSTWSDRSQSPPAV